MGNTEKIKVLYVDDEIINLELFQLMFKKQFDIIIAKSGEEGLQIIKENNNIQLIISDMKMPVMDGLEFITNAKIINEKIPCAILSGYERTDMINKAIESSLIVEYFMKPLDRKKIEEFILNVNTL